MLLMLEDNNERIERFHRVLHEIAPNLPFQIWNHAYRMIEEIDPFLPQAILISLDHDLDPTDKTDPGTGWELTKYLAAKTPICPVLIHTSNSERASWMCGEFELEGWVYERIPPIGDDWIEFDWRRAVRKLLKQHSKKSTRPK
jgi:hypothetical protein